MRQGNLARAAWPRPFLGSTSHHGTKKHGQTLLCEFQKLLILGQGWWCSNSNNKPGYLVELWKQKRLFCYVPSWRVWHLNRWRRLATRKNETLSIHFSWLLSVPQHPTKHFLLLIKVRDYPTNPLKTETSDKENMWNLPTCFGLLTDLFWGVDRGFPVDIKIDSRILVAFTSAAGIKQTRVTLMVCWGMIPETNQRKNTSLRVTSTKFRETKFPDTKIYHIHLDNLIDF